MMRSLIVAILVFPAIVFGQDIKCPKGYQPYTNRCVTQRMADYISCVEASGGNRQQISEEVSEIGGQKASTGIKASGSGTIVKGSGSLLVDRASERTLAKRWETRWFAKGMNECTKVLENATRQDIKKAVQETTKARKIQEQVIESQSEIKEQNQVIIKRQDELKQVLLESMDKTQERRFSELKAKYPYGYCLFAIDHYNIIIPNNSMLLTNYAIDWNSAKILNITKTEVSFLLPTFTEIKSNNYFTGNISTIQRKIGKVHNSLGINDTIVSTELLEDTDKGIVGVIGFRPNDYHKQKR